MTRKLELWAGLLATAVLVVLHAILLFHLGGLWRDEANSVNLATLPSLSAVWASLPFDSFPIGWFLLLRAWSACGLGGDPGLRVLGLLVGLGLLGAVWWNARKLDTGPPLLSLALFGFNAVTLYYGDTLRGYGVGTLLALVTLGLVFSAVERPSPRRLALAGLAAILSVHFLFHNVVTVAAACSGAIAVALRRRSARRALAFVALAALAAASLLPYLGTIRVQSSWNEIYKHPVELSWIWTKFVESASSTAVFFPWIWVALAVLAAAAVVACVRRPAAEIEERRQEIALYCGTALLVCWVGTTVLFKTLGFLMQPWYFLCAMGVAATCLEGALVKPKRDGPQRTLRLLAAVVLMLFALPALWRSAHLRITNVDLVAARIEQSARPGDLIVVTPWYNGVSFARYYRGAAAWMTIPAVSPHVLHRYDQLEQAMLSPAEALRPVLEGVETALRTGQRVFWVGPFVVPFPGQDAPPVPPAPQAPWGWLEVPFYRGLGLQVGDMIRRHRTGVVTVPVESAQEVNGYEKLELQVLQGFRAEHPTRR